MDSLFHMISIFLSYFMLHNLGGGYIKLYLNLDHIICHNRFTAQRVILKGKRSKILVQTDRMVRMRLRWSPFRDI